MTPGNAFLRGQLAYAKGHRCILKADPKMMDYLAQVESNEEFALLHSRFVAGWRAARDIAATLHAPAE